MKNALFILLLAGFPMTSTLAQSAIPAVAQRQKHQHERIRQGVASDELTKKEARHLRARQAKIRKDKRVARMDGVVTPQERKQLRKEQRRASRAIYHQKHDEQHR